MGRMVERGGKQVKVFRAADGRKCAVRMTAEKEAERELLRMAAAVMPVLMIVVFALASGMI